MPKLDTKNSLAAERKVKGIVLGDVYSEWPTVHVVQSIIGFIQLLSVQLQTALQAGVVVFNLLHVTIANLTEEWRKKHIVNFKTIT